MNDKSNTFPITFGIYTIWYKILLCFGVLVFVYFGLNPSCFKAPVLVLFCFVLFLGLPAMAIFVRRNRKFVLYEDRFILYPSGQAVMFCDITGLEENLDATTWYQLTLNDGENVTLDLNEYPPEANDLFFQQLNAFGTSLKSTSHRTHYRTLPDSVTPGRTYSEWERKNIERRLEAVKHMSLEEKQEELKKIQEDLNRINGL